MIKQVRKNQWTTLEWFLSTTGTVVFREPAGARIRIKFGFDPLSFTKQDQMLDGNTRRLLVSGQSIFLARVQIYSPMDTGIAYQLFFQELKKTKPAHYRKSLKTRVMTYRNNQK